MNRQWSIENEEVKAALAGVIRSGVGSYYKLIDNKCVTFRASQVLQDLGMCGAIAARLLAQFPMPVIPFTHNRDRTRTVAKEGKAQQAIEIAIKAEATAMMKSITVVIPV